MKPEKMKRFVLICLLIIFSAPEAYSNLAALEKIYKSLGGRVNATSAGAFSDQAAGYYTGGGLYMRNQNTSVQPVSVTFPHMTAGCNGLDLCIGGFSFMKGEQLMQVVRNIGTSAPTYALQLALKTMAPQVENLLSQLRKVLLDMNGMMLDSCHVAQQIVGGLWPKGSAVSEQICQDVSRTQDNEDWFGARKHCAKPENVQAKVEEAKEKNKDLLQGEYNLTWMIVKDKLKYDDELAHFMMTALGTVISRKEGQRDVSGYRAKLARYFPNAWETLAGQTHQAHTILAQNLMLNATRESLDDGRESFGHNPPLGQSLVHPCRPYSRASRSQEFIRGNIAGTWISTLQTVLFGLLVMMFCAGSAPVFSATRL